MRPNDTNWYGLWDGENYKTQENDLSLKALLNLDGFYTITVETWQAYVIGAVNKLGRDKNAVVLEIGCGTGAFLSVLEPMFDQLWGVDFSTQQIEICRQALPKGHFTVAEADKIELQAGSLIYAYLTAYFSTFPILIMQKRF